MKYLSIRAQAPPNLSIASQDIRLDRYKPTPGNIPGLPVNNFKMCLGAGLIFAYIVAITAMLIGGLMICYSSSYYSSQSMLDDYDEHGMNNRTTLLSAVSGIAGITGIAAPRAYQECSYKPLKNYRHTLSINEIRFTSCSDAQQHS